MSGILSALGGQSSAPAKCADVVFSPDSGNTPLTIFVSTTTVNAHIFYTKHPLTGVDPVHNGDNAGVGTIRIGSNNGSFSSGSGTQVFRAVAYEPTHLDSGITEASYDPA